ncbi:MAG: DUF4956 domain-containing protein [Lachnospiraceae bacterium]|nr:DUF4956 domain-containing protein [Lachnospiraceae bacterium]
MLESLLNGIFTSGSNVISMGDFMLCIVSSIICGLILAFIYSRTCKTGKSFLLSLAILPMIVCVVIMTVNGNVGAGVAVAGAFSLVRFRSNPGTAKEICAIFGAMSVGLLLGMGYIAYGLIFSVIFALVLLVYSAFNMDRRFESKQRVLTITIPESLNYTDVFEDIFGRYTDSHRLTHVKTTNMGSLFKLTFEISQKDPANEKNMIDELRCKNGNLEISVSDVSTVTAEL